MPNLTPIPLSEEEHQRLTSLKHKLEANSWREMLMKLCDIYEEYCQMKFDLPLAKDGITCMHAVTMGTTMTVFF